MSSETSDHFMLSIQKQAMDTHTEAHRGSPMVPLEGAYSPPDDLEEVVILKRPDYTTTIAEGRTEVLNG